MAPSSSELDEQSPAPVAIGNGSNFFLQLSQILDPIPIGAFSHIHGCTGLRFLLLVLDSWAGILKGFQQLDLYAILTVNLEI